MKKMLAPQQARSRESLARLLKATAEILQEMGLEGATIPRIAARAGLSPAAVYRRFPDKDSLLQTLVIKIMEDSDKRTADLLVEQRAAEPTLRQAAEQIIQQTIESYRQYSRLLSAMIRFYRGHPDEGFRRKVDKIETLTFRRVVEYMLHFRKEIRHPEPEAAVTFAFSVAGHSLREIILMELMTDVWSPLLPRSDAQLGQELTAMVLAYLKSGSRNGDRAQRKNRSR